MPSIATNSRVDRDELFHYLRPRNRAVLSTRRPSGDAQMSPVTFGTSAAGEILVSTYPSRAKVTNLRRDPAASLCVLSADWDDAWVQLDGRAEVLDLPEAMEPLVEYFRSISGEHPDWQEYRTAMRSQGKCVLRITIDRWGPLATGGFPPGLVPAG